MSQKLILAVDQGTTNTKAVLVDEQGKPVGEASHPVDIEFPSRGGWSRIREASGGVSWQPSTDA